MCKDCDEHRIVPGDVIDKAYNPDSKQPVEICNAETGERETIPYSKWIKTLKLSDLNH